MAKLRVRDIEMYYQISGEGEALVLIHGLGSSARDWALQTDFFSQRYRVVAYDVRGHGQSDKPPGPYSVPLFAQDLASLIRALEIAPAHVVGISMGGMIAFQLAVDAPELVKSLVIVNSGPELVFKTWRERIQGWQRFLLVRLAGMRKMGEVLSERLLPKPEQAELRRMFVERWAENDPRAYGEAMKALVGWSVSEHLEQITCPVLVVTADQDYTPVEAKAAYVKRLPRGEMAVIKDSRHATPVDQPEEFNRVVMEFLARQT
ncbi:MAG: alpha/beta fold hydrolase [Anaerolineales bacterium]|nr:alpha/beta fold hydrolase [Anaerolineales bacterium]